jgi:tetratricopeptide (TPR) repeat protein
MIPAFTFVLVFMSLSPFCFELPYTQTGAESRGNRSRISNDHFHNRISPVSMRTIPKDNPKGKSMTHVEQLNYDRAVRLHNLAAQCQSAGQPKRPEALYLRALALKQQLFGDDSLEAAFTLNNLGLYYKSLGRLAEARDAYMRALPIFQREFGASHPNVGSVLYNVSQLLKKESEAFEARAHMIDQAAAELDTPQTIQRNLSRFQLSVGPSRIHRFGVFADEAIPAGVEIIEYRGQRVSRREWRKRSGNRTYLLKLNPYWALDGSVNGSGAELINHCCEPNCRFRIKEGRASIESLRPIETGTELTLDYSFDKDAVTAPCYCGAPACRGTINRR